MKRKTVRLYTCDRRLLWFAMRRMLHLQTELPKTWIGLGCPSEYKGSVKRGLFMPSKGRTIPYVLSWYKFTPLGKSIVNQLIRKKICPKHINDMYQTDVRIPKTITVMVPE